LNILFLNNSDSGFFYGKVFVAGFVNNLKIKTMKQNFVFVIAVIFTQFVFHSCSDEPVLHQNITGKPNEMVIVISDESWNGKPGELLQTTLGQSHIALPQEEPVFDLIKIPHTGFKKIFRTTRNIIQTSISANVETPGVIFKDNVWAYPQATVEINAKNAGQFEELFNEYSEKIISYFLSAEKKRLTMNYQKYHEKQVFNALNDSFGFTMTVPPGFAIARQKKDFIWFKFETPEISQGIVVYTFPYISDSTFTENYLVAKNDSVLEINVPGPTEGSYMAVEKRIDQVLNIFEHNKNYTAEMRGLWRLENDFMGGPYVALAELDASNDRIVVAFGYVYAPSKDKRNLLQQVEAMIYSLKMNNQAENDKINSQIKMGN
jgi:hypothetical protein